MFARKKSADVQTSVQRFCDINRDAASRAKHFRLAIELLAPEYKRQLIDDFHFETFHLIDSLLLHPEITGDLQVVYDAESALWTLEQVFCYVPELVGKGWQYNAIEFILKRGLLPRNLLSVRKIIIRLFLCWYQTLAVYNNSSQVLDTVFQCCLPFFPLKNQQQSEQILQSYCEKNGFVKNSNLEGYENGFNPSLVKIIPIIADGNTTVSSLSINATSEKINVKDRAQTLQIYLDKFLEYCCRETMRIEWIDESMRLTCAKFILDRVILFYIMEVFPDIEENGVDIFGGWEGSEETTQILETTDPIVISRYWLIRWMTNIALSSMIEQPALGHLLFRQALLSSQKATNSLLTLMRESMQLPLACSNVMHKVSTLIRCWLLQREIPSFVDAGLVTVEAWNLLLIHILHFFFKNPYLKLCGERLNAAVSLTNFILSIIRELANPATGVLPRQLPNSVWTEIMRFLCEVTLLYCSRSDTFSSATVGSFVQTLLIVAIYIYIIREIKLDDKIWDDIWLVFQKAIWPQIIEQWSKIVENMTRALILNLFAIDVNKLEVNDTVFKAETNSISSLTIRKNPRLSAYDRNSENEADNCGDSGGLMNSAEDDNNQYNFSDIEKSEKDIQEIIQSTGNVYLWLRTWMRIVNLIDPLKIAKSMFVKNIEDNQDLVNIKTNFCQQAVQTLARSMNYLLQCNCANVLVYWLASRLLNGLNICKQPHAIAPLCAVLIRTKEALPEQLRAHILYNLILGLQEDNAKNVSQIILEQVQHMDVKDLTVMSNESIATLHKLLKKSQFSARAVKVAALLALNYSEAEKILQNILENSSLDIDLASLVICINSLSIIILERVDQNLFKRLSILVANHKRSKELLPIFCSNLLFLTKVGFSLELTDFIICAIEKGDLSNEILINRLVNDLKWSLCLFSTREKIFKKWKLLLENLSVQDDLFLEGFLFQFCLQYPLPGFSVSLWNSQTCSNEKQQNHELAAFIKCKGAILSFDKNENQKYLWSRTVVGRHCYTVGTFNNYEEKDFSVDYWLNQLSQQNFSSFKFSVTEKDSNENLDDRIDPFKELPYPTLKKNILTIKDENNEILYFNSNKEIESNLNEMVQAIRLSSRKVEKLPCFKWQQEHAELFKSSINTKINKKNWRQFISDFCLINKCRKAPTNYHREIRHLDSTMSREVHKIAIIYVAKNQDDKQLILSNSDGSEAFNIFVQSLGWLVQIGSSSFFGYTGGLSQGQIAPYFATANTEVIFHVSTMLNGDVTQKLKHLGNDEVHVVWTENIDKPYKRELIATRFCDVLIILYPITSVLIRVHVQTQNSNLYFGPLFDGAYVHIKQIASLVRETVLNASRAYRNACLDCERPNKLREKVFKQTKSELKHLPLDEIITQLYAPVPNVF